MTTEMADTHPAAKGHDVCPGDYVQLTENANVTLESNGSLIALPWKSTAKVLRIGDSDAKRGLLYIEHRKGCVWLRADVTEKIPPMPSRPCPMVPYWN